MVAKLNLMLFVYALFFIVNHKLNKSTKEAT